MKNKTSQFDFLAKCSVCKSALDPVDLVILSEGEQKTIMHVTCAKCNSSAMVFLITNQIGVLTVGMATDLDSAEVKDKFNDKVCTNDVIDSYELAIGKSGGIMEAIKKES